MMKPARKYLSTLFGLAPLMVLLNPGSQTAAQVNNSNPNYAKVHEYGRIEWHGNTAQLITGGSRPLHFAALTISSCLGISVSAEDPHYAWRGDLLDVTAPQWAAQHPDRHVYAAKPGRVDVSFEVRRDGQPVDTTKLLNDTVEQVNQQQPWRFRLKHDIVQGNSLFVFVPTATHDVSGQSVEINSWLDRRLTIRPTTAHILEIANMLAQSLTSDTGYEFSCCQIFVEGQPWGGRTIPYEATEQTGRLILEDLMIAAGGRTIYLQMCEPMDKRFCFIDIKPIENRIPIKAPQSGTCVADGYDPS